MLTEERKSVLVVDDDNLIGWALKKNFSGFGLSVSSVECVADALSELRSKPYDIVFLDISLPDGNGLDLLPEIEKTSPKAVTVVISGNSGEAMRQRAFNGGVVKFLDKPFDLPEVQRILKAAMSGKLKKRMHLRTSCNVPLRLAMLDPAPREGTCDLHDMGGIMEDVGTGGFRLSTGYPLSVGQYLNAHVAGSDPVSQIFPSGAAAKVVWVTALKNGVVAGLSFLSGSTQARTS